jgi:hypothetical protein
LDDSIPSKLSAPGVVPAHIPDIAQLKAPPQIVDQKDVYMKKKLIDTLDSS